MERFNGTVSAAICVQRFQRSRGSCALAVREFGTGDSCRNRRSFLPDRAQRELLPATIRTKPYRPALSVTSPPIRILRGGLTTGSLPVFAQPGKSCDGTEAVDGGASDMVAMHRELQFFQ